MFKALYERKSKRVDTTHICLVLEEAHRYINTGAEESKLGSYYIDKLAREGRKFGVGLIISSQVPSLLSYEIVSQCNSVVMHKINSKKDLWAHAAKPRPRPVGGPPPGRNAPASRAESARRAARHSARSPPSRQKPARVRPAEAHRRLFAAPARLRHSRRPRRRVPLCPQGGIESLGCSGWRPRPPLA